MLGAESFWPTRAEIGMILSAASTNCLAVKKVAVRVAL